MGSLKVHVKRSCFKWSSHILNTLLSFFILFNPFFHTISSCVSLFVPSFYLSVLRIFSENYSITRKIYSRIIFLILWVSSVIWAIFNDILQSQANIQNLLTQRRNKCFTFSLINSSLLVYCHWSRVQLQTLRHIGCFWLPVFIYASTPFHVSCFSHKKQYLPLVDTTSIN